MNKLAFSLVELSIVLVILGLLTGGILTGQSLIRAAELRSIPTEFSQYNTALNTFKQKYFAFPGDMPNATRFWQTMAGGTCPHATSGTGTETCDGNGNGVIEVLTGAANQSNERFTFWQHLANANLITGEYTGIAGVSGSSDHDLGANSPTSKLSNTGWSVAYNGPQSGDPSYFDGDHGHTFRIGGPSGGNSAHNNSITTPEETWNIDKKIDDGKPGLGKVVVRNRRNGCAVDTDGSDLDNSAADAAKITSDYGLANNDILCAIVFTNIF